MLLLFNATFRVQQEQSFATVLDSIAKLSISAPRHEAVAATFRLEGPFIYLYMAGNAQIPRNTVSHIYRLWTLLGHLSDDYEEYHKHSKQTTLRLPITSALPPAAQEIVKLFCREALKFSAEKIDRRISKGLLSFLAISSFELPSSSKLVMLQNILRNIWRAFKARGVLSNERWDEVWGWLRLVDVMTSEMFEEEPDICKSMEQSFPAKRYLEKLVGVTRDVLILQNAANSLKLRHQFKAYLIIKTVDPIGPVAALLPSTRKGWEEVAFNALGETNRGKLQSGEIEYEASIRKVRADAQRLCDRPLPPRHFVHCECTLLSHMLFHGETPFINYIGVSKLCCSGCFHLIQSVNFANGTRFATKGCNHKWCYPWKFPPMPETIKNIVVKRMYTDLADLFGYTYPGFLRLNQSIVPRVSSPQHSIGQLWP